MKSKYETCAAPYLDRIKLWVAKGATQKEVMKKLGVSETTFFRWKQEHREFRESIEAPQGDVDDLVEAALYKRCVGYDYEEVTKWQTIGRGGELIWLERRSVKHLPPDPNSIQFWLTNRRRGEWKRMPEGEAEANGESGVVLLPEVDDE